MEYMRIFTLILLVVASAQAKVFQNSYVQFELPDRWECALEGTEWVCSSLLKDQSKEAIFVLTAKEVGPSDTLASYEAHLKLPKTVPNKAGKAEQSLVKSLDRNKQINGHVWVESMHLGSEIPQYYTRYLATVKDRLAILVTFSAHQLHFTKYSADILKAVQSLKVIADFNLANSKPSAPSGAIGIVGPVNVPLGGTDTDEYPTEAKSSGGAGKKLFAFAVLIAALGAYLFLKKRKK